MSERGDGTRVVRAGLPEADQGAPLLPGPTFAAPFHLRGDPAESEYVYGRYGNPTWTGLERAVGELEGGEAVLFASGMAAVTAALVPRLRAGDVLVLPSDCYMSTRWLASDHLGSRGVEVRQVDTADAGGWHAAITGASFVWLESPSNPGLDVCDIARIADHAHAEGALVAVDNTFATPLGQRPLELGADLSMCSATKHLSGHADLLLGYVVARDPALAEDLRRWRTETGSIAGPFEAWLAHRSLATLDVRLERGCANAFALAEFLSTRAEVEWVRYPGLTGDPAHELAGRQMHRFGTIVSFDLGTRERAEGFLDASELITEATSFGSVHSLAERRARWGRDAISEGFIRLSAGCEDTDDLLDDVSAALAACAAAA